MKNFWNLKLSNITLLFFGLIYVSSFAQSGEPEISLPKDEEYIYPAYPGQPGSLAGNMGELRATHFHGGIDIRTNNQSGHPIVASKSGYISRVAMTPSGYGNVLYIRHPDGNTTLYAHLDQFKEPLANYVLQEQYKRKTFEIDLSLDENQFVVRQGEIIGISGNTGSSGGPHLHFEIRDSNNYPLNPLLFGFKEIQDKTPPVVEKIALITLDANARINDRFGRFEFYAYKSGNSYSVSAPILAYGNIGVEVLAKDKFTPQSSFYGGVNYIDMRVNNQLVFRQAIEKIDLMETRGIYTLMNFKALRTKGSRFYKLYIDDGNVLPFYEASPSSGKIFVKGSNESKIDIRLQDSHGNASNLSFRLKPSPPIQQVKTLGAAGKAPSFEIEENVMVVTTHPCSESTGKMSLYIRDSVATLEPSYYNTVRAVYLIDLRKFLPDSLEVCETSLITNFKTAIPPAAEYKFFSEDVDIEFPANVLYDTLYLNLSFQKGNRDILTVGDRTIPLNKSITITMKPGKEYLDGKMPRAYRVAGRSYTYLGGEWKNGGISFQTRELGDFILLEDNIAPSIRPISINNQTVRFKISDDLSGISSYETTIDGNWLLMHYDSKTGNLRSERLNKSHSLNGELKLVVKDNAGNEQVYTQKIQ